MLDDKTKYSFLTDKKKSENSRRKRSEDDKNTLEKLITIALSWFADNNRKQKYQKTV